MATSAFKSTTKRTPVGKSSPSTDDSPASSNSRAHRRSRSLSRFSRPLPVEIEGESGVVLPTPRRKFVNTVRGSDFTEISLDDLAIEFFSGKDNSDESVMSEIRPAMTPVGRRSRSVSRRGNGVSSPGIGVNGGGGGVNVSDSHGRRGRSVSRRNDGNAGVVNGGCSGLNGDSRRRRSVSVARRNDGNVTGNSSVVNNVDGTARVVLNGDSRRRRSLSVARHHISDSESDIDLSRSSAQSKCRSNSRVASFQRPTVSSQRRLTRSMSQAPQFRSHDGYSSSALTDDDLRDGPYGRNGIEKTIQAVYAQKKIDHPTGDDSNGLYEAMRKELRSAVNEIMTELEQTMERKPSALSVRERLYSSKSDATTRKNYTTKLKQPEKHKQDLLTERKLDDQRGQDGYKIVREVVPESKNNAYAQKVSYSRKRSNDRNRVSKRLNEEAEKYFEDFISNIEHTDFSSFDGERSDTTSSSLVGPTKQRDGAILTQNGNSVSVEMEGINLPWLKWDDNDAVPSTSLDTKHPPTTPKRKLWDPSQDLELIQEHGNQSSSSHGSWNPEHTTTNSTNARSAKLREINNPRFDMNKYLELEKNEELIFDSWMERSLIKSGGLLLCG
ncbi:uncharacterized protein [Rutidosis leptorrhynchoides]|uniref:uncharacterized protein isoform X2 n=1 Tax=Rutidosis leptorrhynchoides TaxID=125765 RepID=UPI003A9900BD